MIRILEKLNTVGMLMEERDQLLSGRMYVKSATDARERIAFIEETILTLLYECGANVKTLGAELAKQERKLSQLERGLKYQRFA